MKGRSVFDLPLFLSWRALPCGTGKSWAGAVRERMEARMLAFSVQRVGVDNAKNASRPASAAAKAEGTEYSHCDFVVRCNFEL